MYPRKGCATLGLVWLLGTACIACESADVAVPKHLLPLAERSLGFEPGVATLAEVQKKTEELGLTCKDASPSVAYAAAKKRRKAKASSGWDAKTSASPKWNKTTTGTKKRDIPKQVRWSCTNVPSHALTDIRNRPEYKGRWLFVFDDESSPLRHVSYRRSHFDLEVARADLRATASDWKIRFERPTHVSTIPPANTKFPRMKPIRFEWNDGTRTAKLSALSITGSRVDILEAIELSPKRMPTPQAAPRLR